jgi:hypothetical protein
MAVIGGVRVYELIRGNSEGLTRSRGPSAAKAYYVPSWYDRFTVANALIGMISYTAGPTGITINAPGAYPESANMWAQEITIKGVGVPTQGPRQIAWTSAIVEVTYSPGDFATSASQDPTGGNSFDPAAPLIYCTQSLDFSAQVVTLPRGTCTLNDGSNTPLAQPYGRTVGVISMDLTLHTLPYLVPAANRATVGQINSGAIFGCAIGTLMWKGAQTRREFGPDGLLSQETTLRFANRPEAPWDQVLHPSIPSKGWTQVQYNGASVLQSFDFTTLIPPAYQG